MVSDEGGYSSSVNSFFSGLLFVSHHYITLISHSYTVSVLGREEGYTVKYNPLPQGVPEGEARGNS